MSSERATKHVFPVNLAQICSAVLEVFHTQTKKVTDSHAKTVQLRAVASKEEEKRVTKLH